MESSEQKEQVEKRKDFRAAVIGYSLLFFSYFCLIVGPLTGNADYFLLALIFGSLLLLHILWEMTKNVKIKKKTGKRKASK